MKLGGVSDRMDAGGRDRDVHRFSGPCHLQRDHRSKNRLEEEIMAPLWTCGF